MAGRELIFDELRVVVHPDTASLAAEASEEVAAVLLAAVAERGEANAMFATGNSQLAFVEELVTRHDVPWESVRMFHMDEYVGVGANHPAGFRRWIRERLAERLPVREVHYIDGTATDAEAEAARYGALLARHPLDLCCLGIGENGHLAFNDPPVANFADPIDVKVVELDRACRQQQVGEGHFPTLADVPPSAITVTVPGLLRSRRVVGIVPEARKAEAVRAALTGPVATACPASALRRTPHATLHLDAESASLLD